VLASEPPARLLGGRFTQCSFPISQIMGFPPPHVFTSFRSLHIHPRPAGCPRAANGRRSSGQSLFRRPGACQFFIFSGWRTGLGLEGFIQHSSIFSFSPSWSLEILKSSNPFPPPNEAPTLGHRRTIFFRSTGVGA